MDRPPTRFDVSSIEGSTVIRVVGDLDSDSAPTLRTMLSKEFDGGRSVIVDLADCPFLDSVGIGTLVYGWKAADTAGGQFHLRNIGRYAQRVLDLVGLSDLIPVA
ncbi:STAS domain-containing protein [Cryptosporangium phraense]|uniref:Anti-sigma factor antagonist n=1 Tax=Cryptosporangium phraense TaxID=2593070 RepID=A0A545AM64_9ACTN|nr:STAS domain-containing protein [Cryptosporangium phraense]TQS42419.1 STAS domain-containing protein [Cryptosporangium phraense]